jgi:hypothetical protein
VTNENPFEPKSRGKLDDLLDRFNARQLEESGEEIPEAGSDGNPWIGFEYVQNGQKKFHALSGVERRRVRRAAERAEASEQAKGQRRYNRQLRRREFDAGTVRQQARILQGEIKVTPALMGNLQTAIMRQMQINRLEDTAQERKEAKANRRAERLRQRQQSRLDSGQRRHRDLVAAFGEY